MILNQINQLIQAFNHNGIIPVSGLKDQIFLTLCSHLTSFKDRDYDIIEKNNVQYLVGSPNLPLINAKDLPKHFSDATKIMNKKQKNHLKLVTNENEQTDNLFYLSDYRS